MNFSLVIMFMILKFNLAVLYESGNKLQLEFRMWDANKFIGSFDILCSLSGCDGVLAQDVGQYSFRYDSCLPKPYIIHHV
jgi:hypothetical protein